MSRSFASFLLLLLAAVSFSCAVALAEPVSGGIGLAVVPTAEGELVVLRVVPDSPAAQADMRSGDLILQVDDFALRGSDFAAVTSRYLWGESGSLVTLKYLRPGEPGLHSVTLQRTAPHRPAEEKDKKPAPAGKTLGDEK